MAQDRDPRVRGEDIPDLVESPEDAEVSAADAEGTLDVEQPDAS